MMKTMPDLISTQWLADRLGQPALVVLDASRHLPGAERDPHAEYLAAHIPGARFLDLAGLVDETSAVPQAIARPDQLAGRLAELGVSAGDCIVFYDDSAIRTAARAWFMCRAHGIESAAILDGGLGKWRDEGRPLDSGQPEIASVSPPSTAAPSRVATKAEMLANLDNGRGDVCEQVIDARGADRVFGGGDDPVHGGSNGRIPGSLNLPFGQVFEPDGTYKAPTELRAAFEAAGIDWDRPIITTCGSGVTASVLLFALHLAGKDDVRLYDGSWMEWSADPATPKAQGPA